MKISIIGAGNVGATAASAIAQESLGDVVLFDIVKGMAQGKAFDMEDARSLLDSNYSVTGTDDINLIAGSDIVVITAGLARKPGMTREELLAKNAAILGGLCADIKKLAPKSIVIVVTNPLDLMTALALKVTGFAPEKVFGMGLGLDASRFANLIAKEMKVPVTDVEAIVIGSHGEGMIPLPSFTKVKGKALDKVLDPAKVEELVKKTFLRGAEIVSLLGSGSAYYAPSAAILELVRAVAKNKKEAIGVCAHLSGEYGLKDVCIGVTCVIGSKGIEKIVELDLSKDELAKLTASAEAVRKLLRSNLNYV